MTTYAEKQEQRRLRYLELADKNDERSQAEYKKADMSEAATGIPFGQPILVGHHSEAGHRRTLDRADKAMRRSIEADGKAAHYRSKAAGVGHGGISSDDPEASTKLQAKIDAAQALQHTMKAANKIVRRKGDSNSKVAALVAEVGFTDAEALKLLTPDSCNRYGFPAYMLSNNNANIKRMQGRVEALLAAPKALQEWPYPGDIRVVVDPEINRTQVYFPGKPAEAVRTALKAHGFRWARSQGAWQRHISNQAWYWADIIARQAGAA